jgi:hypothetical protein
MSSGRSVPDFNDADFNTEDPVAYQRAIRQRVVEHIVATEEMAELQTQLSHCYFREGVNYRKKCRPFIEVLFLVSPLLSLRPTPRGLLALQLPPPQ